MSRKARWALLLLSLQLSFLARATTFIEGHCECAHGPEVPCDCPHHPPREQSSVLPCHRAKLSAASDAPAQRDADDGPTLRVRCGGTPTVLLLYTYLGEPPVLLPCERGKAEERIEAPPSTHQDIPLVPERPPPKAMG